MPLRDDIEKVLMIGSGPIIIGQAAEFDYSGTQACKALREEGIEVVLINSNPATIMTDRDIADSVYIEPVTVDYAREIIKEERPDGLLPTLGGQTGLNLAVELAEAGILEEFEVELLGTDLEAITRGEDRELFRNLMKEIGEPVVDSIIAENYQQALDFTREAGFPVIIRPAYTMGGSGGGIAGNQQELAAFVELGIKRSRINQVLIEKSIAGWKELEYEVIRDAADNCITVCNMENIDPVGIHTGDSIVVAPSQTLSDKEYQLLRSVSIKIIRELDIEGGCNIQFALDPDSTDYYIIEVNPRVSRSSALASKATGYPIARVSAKIALGLHLDEIENSVTENTYACFEPALDYIVTKIPRWPFDKFADGDRRLGSQMKATGEVMAIGRNLKESFLKAVDSLDFDLPVLFSRAEKEDLLEQIAGSRDDRVFMIIRALYSGVSVEEIHEITGMNMFYLNKFKQIVDLGQRLETDYCSEVLLEAKESGFSDHLISLITGRDEQEISSFRKKIGQQRAYKMVDTCAAEFAAVTPYYYSTYDQENEVEVSKKEKVLVVGSGPIRIGQGIEFDYSSVHAVRALQKNGVEAIIVNNNPETVSTDYDTGDKLYFEPLTFEYIDSIIEAEGVKDVILQFGGQTAINLAAPLTEVGVNVLGTNLESINLVEDREQFNQINALNDIPTPPGFTVLSLQEALAGIEEIGFPALVRPSYVLGGRGMEIVYNQRQLKDYLGEAVKLSPEHPVLIDRYIVGREIEVDAIADGEEVLIPGIMEHIEKAGVHSGDSMAVYPARSLTRDDREKLLDFTRRIVRVMNIRGLVNIQFVIDEEGEIFVLEVNPRASRTIPVLSKVTSVPMVDYAVKVMLGNELSEITDTIGLLPPSDLISVKVPVFSFDKMMGIDIHLNPEMKSTGEVLGTAASYEKAVYKGLLGANFQLPEEGNILFSLADRDKDTALSLARKLVDLDFNILATDNTASYFRERGLKVKEIDDFRSVIRKGEVDMVINSPTRGKDPARSGFQLRRLAVEYNLPVYTSLDTVKAVIRVLQNSKNEKPEIYPLTDYYKQS